MARGWVIFSIFRIMVHFFLREVLKCIFELWKKIRPFTIVEDFEKLEFDPNRCLSYALCELQIEIWKTGSTSWEVHSSMTTIMTPIGLVGLTDINRLLRSPCYPLSASLTFIVSLFDVHHWLLRRQSSISSTFSPTSSTFDYWLPPSSGYRIL